MADATDDLLVEARARFKRAAEAEEPQRQSILEAKNFRAGNQWPDEIKIQRQGGPAITGQAAQPPRPCLTIDRLSQPVRQTSNAIRAANFTLKFIPNGHGSDVETARIYDGLARRMQNQARGEDPVAWAADGAAEGGLGWVRMVTRYVKTPKDYVGPEVFDQECALVRIANSLTVYCDPFCQQPTKADARYMFVTEDLPRSEAKKYGLKDDDLKALDDFIATGDTDGKDWANDKEGTIRIVDYYRLVESEQEVYQLADGSIVTDKPEDAGLIVKTRTRQQTQVKVSKLCAVKELESATFPGSRIPLFPVLGEEMNVDGRAVLRGIIQPGMDAQRMVNYTYSGAIETVALAPKAPFIVAEGQLEGYEAIWQQANRFNYSYLPYKPTTLVGQPVAPPQRDNIEPPIQAMVQMLFKSEEAVKVTTGVFDPSLGKSDPNLKTARATMAVIQESEAGRSHYIDNTRRALLDIGSVCCEVFPIVYDRPGRILDILGVDDKPEQVMVGQAYEQKGQEIQPRPELSPEMVKMQKGLVKFYDLTQGQYSVTVDVGKAHSTARAEGNEAMGELIPHMPPPMQMAVLPSYVEGLSFPGAHEAAELMRKTLPPEFRQTGEGEGPDMTTLTQENMQLKTQLEQTTKFAQDLHEQLTTKQVEQQGKLQDTQLKEQGATQRTMAQEQAQNERTLVETEAKIKADALKALVQLAIAEISASSSLSSEHAEMARTALGFSHEHAQGERDRQLQASEGEAGRQSDARENAATRALQRDESEQNRQFDAEQAEAARQAEAAAEGGEV